VSLLPVWLSVHRAGAWPQAAIRRPQSRDTTPDRPRTSPTGAAAAPRWTGARPICSHRSSHWHAHRFVPDLRAEISRLGNLSGVDVLPASAVLNLPLETTASEVGSRLGVRFVHWALQMSKGQWRLSLEMFDTYLQRFDQFQRMLRTPQA
jgi:hypothetical protein